MILKLYSLQGVYTLFSDSFEFIVKRHHGGFIHKHYYTMDINGREIFESYPYFKFNKKENAEKLKSYIISKFNNDYPTIDIRKCEEELYKNDTIRKEKS